MLRSYGPYMDLACAWRDCREWEQEVEKGAEKEKEMEGEVKGVMERMSDSKGMWQGK